VEALFCGEASAVEAMVAACRVGPPNAQVTHVATESATASDDFSFRQLPTF
jgi:acylphosphatase